MERESQNITGEEENSLESNAVGVTLFLTFRESLYQRVDPTFQPQTTFLRRVVCIQ